VELKELVNQVFLHAGVTRQQISNEDAGKAVLLGQHASHFFLINLEQSARSNRTGGNRTGQLRCCDTLFSAKIACPKQRYDGLFTASGSNTEPDASALNVKDIVGGVTLKKTVSLSLSKTIFRPTPAFARYTAGLKGDFIPSKMPKALLMYGIGHSDFSETAVPP
jgi:hypothetical protein